MKHNRIIILAATAMAFAGCSSTDDLEGQSGKELKFTSDISAITPVKMETRASVLATSPDIEAMTLAEKDTILPENQILTRTDSWSARSTSDVAVQIGGGNVYKYAVDNNGVLSSSSTYYFTSLSDQTVAAWFPYSAAFSQFSVKGDQRTLANYNASDLLYATCTVNQNSTGNDLTFAHKTAKIIVNVTVENANYLLNSTINSVTLSGVNLTGSFSNGTLTATNTTGTVQMYNSSASTVTGTTAAATFEACVAPKSSTGDITVTVNVGGTNYTGTLSGGKNLRAGYGHNIFVKLTATLPVADMLDVIFAQNGTATDQSTSRWPLTSYNPSVAWNSTYGRYEAIFNNATSADSYYYLVYSVYETFREKMKDGFTYECLVKIDPTITHEQKFFGGLQDGGGCLGFSGGKFFASFWIGNGYKQVHCTSTISANKYYHVVGVWDKPNGKVLVYLNGALEGTRTDASGEFRFPQASDYTLAIGADQSGSATSYENNTAFVGRFVIGRVYDKILTANEISKLYCSVKK